MRLIDADKLIDEIKNCLWDWDSVDGITATTVLKQTITDIENQPTVMLKEQEAKIEHLKRPDCEHAEHDGIGCLGYAGCTQDDEPIDACKECEKYTGNVFEAVKLE